MIFSSRIVRNYIETDVRTKNRENINCAKETNVRKQREIKNEMWGMQRIENEMKQRKWQWMRNGTIECDNMF